MPISPSTTALAARADRMRVQLALLALLGSGAAPTLACTSLLVGHAASDDGSILLARSDDGSDAISDTNNLVWHSPRAGPAVWRSNMNDLQVGAGPGRPGSCRGRLEQGKRRLVHSLGR